MVKSSDTIFALSSGRPPAAIAVIRISGPRAGDALRALIGRVPEPRKAALARVRNPADGETIDEAVALWFPGPASETGEDVAELQLHGGRAIIAGVCAALASVEGLRAAEPGEFTRRAFVNGKIDLTRVEGLADLIAADTQAQRRHALKLLRGWLGDKADDWRRRLIEARALIEAQIDFPDEGDVPRDLTGQVLGAVAALRDEIAGVLAGAGQGERLRDGMTVVIAGPENVGKSSLINLLVRREVAIVSDIAGTTRDVIEAHLDLGGYPVTLLDTAGIRDSNDPVEQEGIRRARARAGQADLVLWVVDASDSARLKSAVASAASAGAEGRRHGLPQGAAPVWLVFNKIDTLGRTKLDNLKSELSSIDLPKCFISVVNGVGTDELLRLILDHTRNFFAGTEAGLITRARHREQLEQALAPLVRIMEQGASIQGDEIMAEELRLAADALGRLTGRIDVEDVLDVIFRDFCIGK
jgi:tRNA modification GTPase